MSDTPLSARPQRLAFPPNWPARIGFTVLALYVLYAGTVVDITWARFLSGLETDAYVDDLANVGLHDVNTIANYDPDVIPLLDAPAGSAFERDDEVIYFRYPDPRAQVERWSGVVKTVRTV